MADSIPPPIFTRFTELMGCAYPIIAAPMFLVSSEKLVIAASEAGGVGGIPSLNWRTAETFDAGLSKISAETKRPYAVNLIVNRSSPRTERDLDIIVKYKVPMVITSLGNPKRVIDAVHAYGGKVFCDVTNLKHALKVQEEGADGLIAVSAGAGGHAGPISPMVLIPYLKQHLSIPVIAAGGMVNGRQILAALILGADAVQIGTRFIAADESAAGDEYKKAVLTSSPEDIVMTLKLSGTPAAVINTEYVQKAGLNLNLIEKFLRQNPKTMKYAKLLRVMSGTKSLEKAAVEPTWKNVWTAGQGVGMIDGIKPVSDIMRQLAREYWEARHAL